MEPIPYGKQDITDDDIQSVIEVLKSDFLTQGPRVAKFEKDFSEYIGAKFCIAVSNGTAALHLACLALGVNSKSRIITTPITFAASANCIQYCGGKVEFVDIDSETALIDLEKVAKLLRSHPKGYFQGIIPVDFAGLPVDMERLKDIADSFGLWIIEDACHAPGAFFKDSNGISQKSGNCAFSDIGIFSFHPVKHIATGEGGMITTNNENLYKRLLKLRTHGITRDSNEIRSNHGGWYYEMQELGYNYRLPDMLCALGSSQIKRADERLKRRIEIAKKYDYSFKNHQFIKPLTEFHKLANKGLNHAYHLYVIQVPRRLELYNKLRESNIFAQVHYIPVHKMPFYQKNSYQNVSCPNAEVYYEHCLSLPMYPTLTDSQQQYVIDTILNFFKG